jgi:hypothetical protein
MAAFAVWDLHTAKQSGMQGQLAAGSFAVLFHWWSIHILSYDLRIVGVVQFLYKHRSYSPQEARLAELGCFCGFVESLCTKGLRLAV